MELSRIVVALRRRWWILILALIVGGAVGVVATKLQTPQYTATTRLFVSTTGGTSSTESYSGEQFSQQRTSSYAQMITSELITERVVNDLNLPTTATELSSRVTATIVPRTVLLDVSATDTSPRRAADIANALAQKFVEFIGPLETPIGQEQPRSTIAVVKTAEVPTTASAPQLRTNLFYGILGGLGVGILGILLSAMTMRRIYSADELKSITRTPVLGPITSAHRTPDERFNQLATGYSASSSAHDIRRIRVQIEAQVPPPQVLLLAPASAGTSAVNVAIDLAIALAEAGRETALVCADPQFEMLATDLGLETDGLGLSDLLDRRAKVDDVIKVTPRSTLVIVPPGSSADVTSMLSSPAMSHFIENLRNDFERIVVVTASVNENSDASVLSAIVDANILVVDPHTTKRRDIGRSMTEFKSARAKVVGAVLVKS